MKWKKKLQEEKGSSTIEFLAMIPLVLFIMMVFFQFIIVGYCIIVTQSAASEAAKVYSLTQSAGEAQAAASKIIDTTGDSLRLKSVTSSGSKEFETTVNVELNLMFVPENFAGSLSKLDFSRSISGRVIE